MTAFLTRLAALAQTQTVTLPVPMQAGFAQTMPASENKPKPKPARIDVAKAVEDMGEWCADTHDLPDLLMVEI